MMPQLSYQHHFMYWIFDALCFLQGVVVFVTAVRHTEWLTAIVALLWIWIYPFILEYAYNLTAILWSQKISYSVNKTCRFVYHPRYSISLWGLQKFHPFDSQKYASIYQKMLLKKIISPQNIMTPSKPSRRFLLQKMSKSYLIKLCYSVQISKYIELPYWFLPAWFLRWKVLDPMLLATEGSILAACLAINRGWAVNLSGGFHHASWDKGGGFCIYPDISLTIHYLKTRLGIKKIMIIDLDAHQGNGYQKDFVIDEDVYIVDCYNHKIYPQDQQAKEKIGKNMPISHSTSNQQYLRLVDQIKHEFLCFQPQFVIYNAGTDILANDPLGKLQISSETIIERDCRVVGMCMEKAVPIVMLLSGGYQSTNADIIADSIQNLLRRFP